MSHFYGDLQGTRGPTTRQGHKSTGMTGHIRGWNLGARATMHHDPATDTDHVSIELTGGSSGADPARYLGNFTRDDLCAPIVVLTGDQVEALKRLVDYTTSDEAANYAEASEADKDNHIYHAICELRQALADRGQI